MNNNMRIKRLNISFNYHTYYCMAFSMLREKQQDEEPCSIDHTYK